MTEAAAAARPSSPYYTEPSRLQVGDLDVAYRREGLGEPVVFLHGAGWHPDVAARSTSASRSAST